MKSGFEFFYNIHRIQSLENIYHTYSQDSYWNNLIYFHAPFKVENKINSLLAGQLEASDEDLENELMKLMLSESEIVSGTNVSSSTYTDLDLHKLPEAPVTSLIIKSDQVESITLPRQLASPV